MSLGLSNTASSKKYYQYRSIKGMNFDGTDDNCYNDANPGVNLFTAHTLSAWFRTTDVTADQGIVCYSDNGSRRCGLVIDANNGVESIYYGGSGYSGVANTSVISNDTWYHVATTQSGSDKVLYLNGVVQTGTYAATTGLTANVTVVGGKANDGSDGMKGDIDEVAIWNAVLTADEIKGLYNNGRPRHGLSCERDTIKGYWRLNAVDDTGSNNVIDYSGEGHHGTTGGDVASGDFDTTDVPA